MIPKRIHYVWVGSDLPDQQRRHVDSWRRTNPDFELVLWTERNIDFSNRQLRKAYDQRLWAKVADIARLVALSEQGGFYLDVDFELYKSLSPLLGEACVLGFQSVEPTPDWIANGAMAAEPGHWFIRHALEQLSAMRPRPFGLDRPTRYGPKLITRLAVEAGLMRYAAEGVRVKDIYVCPTQYFFPWAFGEKFQEGLVTPETYGMHLWEKSWEKDVPVLLRVGKAVRDRARTSLRAIAR